MGPANGLVPWPPRWEGEPIHAGALGRAQCVLVKLKLEALETSWGLTEREARGRGVPVAVAPEALSSVGHDFQFTLASCGQAVSHTWYLQPLGLDQVGTKQ